MWSRWMILRIFVPFICSQAESKGVVDGVVDVGTTQYILRRMFIFHNHDCSIMIAVLEKASNH